MKGKRKITAWLMVFAVLVASLLPGIENRYQGASSYTNAKDFFNSTGNTNNGKHVEVKDGTIYFANKLKLASAPKAVSYKTTYRTVGYDITLTGGGATVSFAVKNGKSIKEIESATVNSNEQGIWYQYCLLCVDREVVIRLATEIDPDGAKKLLGAEGFQVRMDAIIVRNYGGMSGSIEEDGNGGLKIYSPNNNYTWVWRLKDPKQLQEADNLYSGNKTFESVTDIRADFENFKLDVYYAVDGLPAVSANSSSHVTVATGWRTGTIPIGDKRISYGLGDKNGAYVNSARLAENLTLLSPLKSGGPAITKTGYHLDGEVAGKEWITETGRTYAAGGAYGPANIEPATSGGNASICLYANWKPNTYTFEYYANGGTGTMSPSIHTYDKAGKLTENKFSKEGYNFMGWSTTPNGSVEYIDGQNILNETTENGKVIKLYAVWQKKIFKITLNDDGATTPGSAVMYEAYEKGFYSDKNATSAIANVTKPAKTGYTFGGYFDAKNGGGAGHIDALGKITAANTAFKQDRTIYAKWKANTYTIRYNGVNGTLADSPATYDKSITLRPNVFTRRGYNFAGWARTEGGAVVYTDKEMVKNITSVNGAVIDLYAVWEPITAQITLQPQEGSGGTGYFYEKFGVNFYINSSLVAILDRIITPARTGYDFLGYFADILGSGSALIGSDGSFGIDNTYFVQDTSLWAKWIAKTYTLTLNKEGGVGGSDTVTATYDKLVPGAESVPPVEAPKRDGFEFKGYYTGKNGTGTKFYSEFMYSDIVFKSTQDTPLYAYWVDNYAPTVSLNGNDKWTNSPTTLEATATDYGLGLKSLIIYRIGEDGSLTVVATANNLNGAQSKSLTFANTTQGVVRYKAVAEDMNGNKAESYSTVYYDTVKPTGTIIQFTQSETNFAIIVDVTDANTNN